MRYWIILLQIDMDVSDFEMLLDLIEPQLQVLVSNLTELTEIADCKFVDTLCSLVITIVTLQFTEMVSWS